MGEIISNNKPGLILLFLLFLFLSWADAQASYRELDLFDKGYEDYLAYRPEKAVEEFQAFLKEFPDSSVKDAAMYWLAKSFMQLKDLEMAGKVFSDLKLQFPGSPFSVYATKELESVNKTESKEKAGVQSDIVKKESTKEEAPLGPIPGETEKKAAQAEEGQQQKPGEEPVESSAEIENETPAAGGEQQKAKEESEPAKIEEKATEPEKKEAPLEAPTVAQEGGEEKGEAEKKTEVVRIIPGEVENKTPAAGDEQQKAKEGSEPAKVEEKASEPEKKEASSEASAGMQEGGGGKGDAEKKTEVVTIIPEEIDKRAAQAAEGQQQKPDEEQIAGSGEIEKMIPAAGDEQQKAKEELEPAKVEEKATEPEKKETSVEALPAETVLSKVQEAEDKALPAGDDKKSEVLPATEKIDASEAYILDSTYVLTKLDVKNVLWRNGNPSEDIENEKLLFEEAVKSNISVDDVSFDGLVLKYEFNSGQADYLKRYLTICGLLDRKLKDKPEERVVESLVVKYEEGNRFRKIVIAPELQTEAKKGTPFEDIQKLYPDLVKVVVAGYDAVEADLKEKIRLLPNDEIGVIWSDEGYVILKPVLKKLSCKPFEEVGPDIRNKIKAFITEWLAELKKPGK